MTNPESMGREYHPPTMVIRTLTPEMRLTEEEIHLPEETDRQPVTEEDCPALKGNEAQ